MKSMPKKGSKVKIILTLLLICVLLGGLLYANDCIGVLANRLEDNIRTSQKIPEDWIVEGSVSDTMAAFICYSQDKRNPVFSVYVNRPGVSFGYFFRIGGTTDGGELSRVDVYTVDGYDEVAYISANDQKVEYVEIDDGQETRVIDIDSKKPFALVLPADAGIVHFYDVNGALVECRTYAG